MPTKKTPEAAAVPAARTRSAAVADPPVRDRNMIWAVSVLAGVVLFGAGYLVGQATGDRDDYEGFGFGDHRGVIFIPEGHCCRPGHEFQLMPPFYGQGEVVPMPGYSGDQPGISGGGYLGIRGLNTPMAVEVVEVVPGSPADEAGIESGDHIVSYDGTEIVSMEQLADLVAATQPGTQVELIIGGPGGGRAVTVKVGERP